MEGNSQSKALQQILKRNVLEISGKKEVPLNLSEKIKKEIKPIRKDHSKDFEEFVNYSKMEMNKITMEKIFNKLEDAFVQLRDLKEEVKDLKEVVSKNKRKELRVDTQEAVLYINDEKYPCSETHNVQGERVKDIIKKLEALNLTIFNQAHSFSEGSDYEDDI